MHHHKKSAPPTPGRPAPAAVLEARLEQAGAAADALRQVLLDLAAACQQLRDQLPVPNPPASAAYPNDAAPRPPRAESPDPAPDQLPRARKIAAAETAAHRQRLAELNRERLQWLRDHGASAPQIAATETAARREQIDLQIAAARYDADQIQADLDRRKARPSNADTTAAADAPRSARAQSSPATHAARAPDDAAAPAPTPRHRALRADPENQARFARESSELATQRALADQMEMDQRKAALLHLPVAMEHGPNGNTVLNFGQLAEATGKTNAQIEGLLKGILDHHYQLQNVILTLQSQFNTLQHQLQSQGFNRL